MAISNLFAVFVGLVQYPVLLRIYQFSPDSFGVFQYLLSTVMIISSFSCLAFDTSFISEHREHNQWQKEQFLGWYIAVSNLLGIGIWIITGIIIKRTDLLFLISGICILVSQGIYEGYCTLARDARYFKQIAIVSTLLSVYKVILVIPIGYFMRNEVALVIAFVISNILAILYFIRALKVCPRKPRIDFIKQFVAENKTIIIFETATRTLNTFSFNLPVFLLGRMFGGSLLGLYSLAYRLISTTNRMFSLVMSQTFFSYMSKSREDEIKIYSRFHYVPLLFFPLYFLISAFSDFYVPILFGNANAEIAGIIKILVPWMFSSAVCTPAVSSYFVHRQNIELFVLSLVFILARVFALVGFSNGNYETSLMLFSGVSVLFSVIFFIRAHKFADANFVKSLLLIAVMIVLMFGSIFRGEFLIIGYAATVFSAIISFRFYVNIFRTHFRTKAISYDVQSDKNI